MRLKKSFLFISSFILRETEIVLREKFKWERKETEKAINRLQSIATLIDPKIKISIIKVKDDDNRILECAVEGKADYIITGDTKHLLPLKEYRGIKILTPKEFLEILDKV